MTITIDDLCRDPQRGIDRRVEYPLTASIQHNLDNLAWKLNDLCRRLPKAFLPLKITSGYRPGHYNKEAGGAPGSLHMTGMACDFANVGNALGSYLLTNPKILEDSGLYAEHPEATKGNQRLHLQSKPPKSGKRFFYP